MGKNLATEYWINNEDSVNKHSCPNVSLFRFIGSLLGDLNGKKVLEIGFNNGADLIECKKRGAEVYGIDINPKAVNRIKKTIHVNCSRSGKDPIPFQIKFDIIYTRDTIYYLSDSEINFFFKDLVKNINNDGIIIIQYIENDFHLEPNNPIESINFNLFKDAKLAPIFPVSNPVRFLSAEKLINSAKNEKLNLVASKRMLQSYDLNEERFRLDRYLAFKKE